MATVTSRHLEGCSFQTGIRQSALEMKCSSGLVLGPVSGNAHPLVPAGSSPAASPLPLASTCCCSPGLCPPLCPTPSLTAHPPRTDPTHSKLLSCSEFLSARAVVLLTALPDSFLETDVYLLSRLLFTPCLSCLLSPSKPG